MMDFFAFIYSWLIDLYGDELDNFMWDVSDGQNYIIVGSVMMIIALILSLIHYIIVDKPNWGHWWCWLIMFAINALLNLWWGWQPTLQNLYDGFMDVKDPKTGQMIQVVTETNCFMFGIATMILGAIFFIAFSLICSPFSTNNKYSPFVK